MASINVANHSKKKAVEPSMYVHMEKRCKRCKQSNVKFKFLNNKKQNQPRYQCQDCTLELGKPYHFNPFPIREHNHKDGYAKLSKVETKELKNLNKVCDRCQAKNNATFRGYNNGKVTQPRYACKVCRHLFSPLKNSKATSTKMDVSSDEFQTTGVQYQETGALQQPSNIDVSSYEFQTTETQYQETGALQQPNNIDVSSCEFQAIGAQYQETRPLQQPSDIGVSSYEFQTTGAQYQETGASQQPSNIDISSYEFQTTGAQYQETAGTSQQPLPFDTLYEQTSILYQQFNYYNPYGQSSDNHPVSIRDVDGSSNQFLFPWQNAEFSQWQQPSLYNTSYDQTSIASQQQSYNYLHNQSSDNHSLASVDANGSSNQFAFPSQNAEALQWQQPSLYNNTMFDQTSISSQQHSYDYPYNQSSDNRSLASMDVAGSSNQYPFPSQNVEAWQWQQPSLYASVIVDGFSNQFPIPLYDAEAWQQASLYNPLGQQTASIPSEQHRYCHPQGQSNNNYPCVNF